MDSVAPEPTPWSRTIGAWGDEPTTVSAAELADDETDKKTFEVPLDWRVEAALLNRIVHCRLNEITRVDANTNPCAPPTGSWG